ncbi:unnamed protein product, partial [Closterium sp. Naga37s-1]
MHSGQLSISLSSFRFIPSVGAAITTARPVKNGNDKNGGKGGPPDAGSCPLPKPNDAQALGNLTAILAARLNGSRVDGPTGDVKPTGLICLAVFELDGDYNVFYSIAVSTSDAGEPSAVSIYQGAAAGDPGTLVHRIVELENGATWTNLTRPPPPPPKGKKNKGAPARPYTYATNGTWLKSSTLATIGGQTLKELVDAIIAKPDGYYTTFSSDTIESTTVRGQFKSDPVPPPPKDKKGGKDGGTTGNDTNTTVSPGKNGKDKNGGKGGPPDAGPCPLLKPSEAEALGNLTAILAARLNGSQVVGATGDVNRLQDHDYNIFYSVAISTSDPGEPSSVSIWRGAAGEAGTGVYNIIESGQTATWANLTRPPPPPPKGKKNKGTPPALPPPKYTYATNGTWLKASTVATIGGQALRELVETIIEIPDGYYASFTTAAYESSAARGQFKKEPLPPPPKDKKGGKNGGKKGGSGGENGDDRSPTTSDYNIKCHVSVTLTDSGEPTGFVIKKGADVALTMDTIGATWTNRTFSGYERAKLGKQLPPPPLGYSYESVGAWLSASSYIADNGQTYMEVMNAMLAAPDAYSALVYTR